MNAQDTLTLVGALTALLMGLAKAIAFLAEALGIRPKDRRAERMQRLEECEKEIDTLKQRVRDLEEELQKAEEFIDSIERMFRRAGIPLPERPGHSTGGAP